MHLRTRLAFACWLVLVGVLLWATVGAYVTVARIQAEAQRLAWSNHQLVAIQLVATAVNRQLKEGAECIVLGQGEWDDYEMARSEAETSIRRLLETNASERDSLEDLADEEEEQRRLRAIESVQREVANRVAAAMAQRQERGEQAIVRLLQDYEQTVETRFDGDLQPLIEETVVAETRQVQNREARMEEAVAWLRVITAAGCTAAVCVAMGSAWLLLRRGKNPDGRP